MITRVVELAGGVVVAVGSPSDDATFTLTEDDCDDRRAVTVRSIPDALAELTDRCQRWPQAAAVCDDVLQSIDPDGPARAGIVTESLAYSTLQSGPEFARWLAERGPVAVPDIPDPVHADRDGDRHLRRVSGEARDAFGQAVEHGHGGVVGRLGALLQHRRRQRGERGGVGCSVQFRMNLRRPPVVDRGSAAEHEDRRDERIHHRDIAAAVTQQAIKTECRHGDDPTFCRGARVWVKTVRLG